MGSVDDKLSYVSTREVCGSGVEVEGLSILVHAVRNHVDCSCGIRVSEHG